MSRRPWINYHHLLYFKTIANEGGIAKAAKKLRLGQPTLSTQLKQFESMLGQSLFDRSKRNLQLTEAGRLVLGYANEIFKMGEEMIDALNDQHQSAKVQVQIGVMDTVPKQLTIQMFEFARKSHDCVISISEGHGDELMRELRAHRVDLVLSNFPPPVGVAAGFYAKCIGKMPVIICGTPNFLHLKRGFPRSLEGQEFVMSSMQSKLRHDVEHFFKLNEIHVNTVAEVQDTSLQKLLGSHGNGLIPVSRFAVVEMLKSKDLVNIGTLDDVYEEFWIITAKRRLQNPIAELLMRKFSI